MLVKLTVVERVDITYEIYVEARSLQQAEEYVENAADCDWNRDSNKVKRIDRELHFTEARDSQSSPQLPEDMQLYADITHHDEHETIFFGEPV